MSYLRHKAAAHARPVSFFPREHGAWGMLLIPLGTAAGVVGRWDLSITLFLIAVLALFLIRVPGEALLRGADSLSTEAGSRAVKLLLVGAVAALVSGAGVVFLYDRYFVMLFGLLAFVAYAGQVLLGGVNGKHRLAVEIIGALAMSSTAAAAHYVLTGRLDRVGWILWLLFVLFSLNQIQHVRLRIRLKNTPRGRVRMKRSFSLLLLLSLTWLTVLAMAVADFLPWAAAVAFLPFTLCVLGWLAAPPKALKVRRLGLAQLAMALWFSGLLIGGLRWSGIGLFP